MRACHPFLLFASVAVACSSDASNPGTAPPREPPPFTVGSFSIQLPSVTIEPGDEIEPCYVLPIELEGPSRIVGGAVLTTQLGMHHGNVTSRPVVPGESDCGSSGGDTGLDIANGGAVLFASSTQISGEEWYSFPSGMGYRIDDTHEIVARMHYLNAGDTPITVSPTYHWYTIDEAKVTHELAPFIWQYQGFEIAPGQELTVVGECRFPRPHQMHVVTLLPHMHKLGTAMYAEQTGGEVEGDRFLDSPGYDPEKGVLTQYDPAIDLSGAEGFRFSCSWNNTLDVTVVEGIGDNEMCMVFGYAWPRGDTFNALAGGAGCITLPTPD